MPNKTSLHTRVREPFWNLSSKPVTAAVAWVRVFCGESPPSGTRARDVAPLEGPGKYTHTTHTSTELGVSTGIASLREVFAALPEASVSVSVPSFFFFSASLSFSSPSLVSVSSSDSETIPASLRSRSRAKLIAAPFTRSANAFRTADGTKLTSARNALCGSGAFGTNPASVCGANA